jgi:hypothetical protein
MKLPRLAKPFGQEELARMISRLIPSTDAA